MVINLDSGTKYYNFVFVWIELLPTVADIFSIYRKGKKGTVYLYNRNKAINERQHEEN